MTSLSNKKIILTVVRHGQTSGNKESILQGQNEAKIFLNSHLNISSTKNILWQSHLHFISELCKHLCKDSTANCSADKKGVLMLGCKPVLIRNPVKKADGSRFQKKPLESFKS